MNLSELDIPTISSGALLGSVILSILKGWLVPRRILVDAVAALNRVVDAITKDRDDWREAAQSKDTTIKTLADQLDEAIEMARTTQAVLNALPRAVRNGTQR